MKFLAQNHIPFTAPNFSGQSSNKAKTSKAAGSSSGGSTAKSDKGSEAKAKAPPPAVAKTQVKTIFGHLQLTTYNFPGQVVEVFEYDPLLGYCTVKRKTVPILEVSEHGSTPPPTTTASVNLNFLQVTVSCKYPLIAFDFRHLLHHHRKRKKLLLRRKKNQKV